MQQQANKQQRNNSASHNQPTQHAHTAAANLPTSSLTSPPPIEALSNSAYPPYSTHAVAEALLAESYTTAAVPLSSLPAVILSHCSPDPLPSSALSANSSALLRLQSMCSEPSTALLCRSFDDLHSRGCVVTAGQLYGGDLLLYAADPSSCHAHSIVNVCTAAARSHNDEPAISALHLLTVARIASGVSKGVVLAYEEEATQVGDMSYLTLHWQSSLSAAQ